VSSAAPGGHGSCPAAAGQHEIEQSGVGRGQAGFPGQRRRRPDEGAWRRERAGSQDVGQDVGVDDRAGGHVEGAVDVVGERSGVGVGDVVGVEGLEPQALWEREHRQPAGRDQPVRQEGPGEDPTLLAGRRLLEADDVALLRPRHQAAIEVQVRPADRGRGHPHDRVGRLLDGRIGHAVDPDILSSMPHDSSHVARPPTRHRPTRTS
jgi:hypothetical protein